MELVWNKKTPESFDLVRSDGVVLARCINDRGIVVARVYNALPAPTMKQVTAQRFDFMAPAMDWCNQQLVAA